MFSRESNVIYLYFTRIVQLSLAGFRRRGIVPCPTTANETSRRRCFLGSNRELYMLFVSFVISLGSDAVTCQISTVLYALLQSFVYRRLIDPPIV